MDGQRCSGSLFDFGLYFFHCAKLVRTRVLHSILLLWTSRVTISNTSSYGAQWRPWVSTLAKVVIAHRTAVCVA